MGEPLLYLIKVKREKGERKREKESVRGGRQREEGRGVKREGREIVERM